MRISIKSNKEIEKMWIAGSLAAEVLEMISPFVVPGISTGELDKICYEHIVNKQNAIPANVGYKGYEKTICSSINQVICHGIPNNEKFLKEGDILNIDVTVIKDGWHGDTSKMFLVGKCAPHNERLVKITQEGLYEGINEVRKNIKEDEKTKPVLSYSSSKATNEKQLKESGKNYIILRLGSVYGYSTDTMRIDIMPNLFSKIASQNGTLKLFAGGRQIKSLVPLIEPISTGLGK